MIDYPIAGPRFTEADAQSISLRHVEITDRDGTVSSGIALHLTGKRYLLIMSPAWAPGLPLTMARHTVFLADVAAARYIPSSPDGDEQSAESS